MCENPNVSKAIPRQFQPVLTGLESYPFCGFQILQIPPFKLVQIGNLLNIFVF